MLNILILAGFLAAATSSQSEAPVSLQRLSDIPNTSVQYYDVQGTDITSINRSIARQRPSAGGTPIAAATDWTVNAVFKKHTEQGRCSVVDVEARFAASAELPRLVDEQRLKPEILARWRKYVAGLEASEATNLIYVFYHLDEVEKAISASSCEDAKAVGLAAVETLKARAAAFERERELQARKEERAFGDMQAPDAQAANTICKTLVGTGSRLNTLRVCMTKREWAKLHASGEQATREMQDKRRTNRPF
jgi:predicted secreted Zn-dependent protease